MAKQRQQKLYPCREPACIARVPKGMDYCTEHDPAEYLTGLRARIAQHAAEAAKKQLSADDMAAQDILKILERTFPHIWDPNLLARETDLTLDRLHKYLKVLEKAKLVKLVSYLNRKRKVMHVGVQGKSPS